MNDKIHYKDLRCNVKALYNIKTTDVHTKVTCLTCKKSLNRDIALLQRRNTRLKELLEKASVQLHPAFSSQLLKEIKQYEQL